VTPAHGPAVLRENNSHFAFTIAFSPKAGGHDTRENPAGNVRFSFHRDFVIFVIIASG